MNDPNASLGLKLNYLGQTNAVFFRTHNFLNKVSVQSQIKKWDVLSNESNEEAGEMDLMQEHQNLLFVVPSASSDAHH